MQKLLTYANQFPITENDIYLNHAAVSPFSNNVINALNSFFKKRLTGDVDPDPFLFDERETLKKNISHLINGKAENIAIIANTSEGLNWLANSLEWKDGDRVLLTDYEFPANVYPFLNLERFGVAVDYVQNRDGKILIEDIESAITPKTRLLSISFVEFLNGFRNNLLEIGRICKSKNVIFSVDGIQGVGALEIDVEEMGIDFMSNGGHKWLMGPQGCGFMYIRPGLHKKLKPVFAGWLGVKDSSNFLDYNLDFIDDAARYEIGTLNEMGIIGLKSSTKILKDIGPENIEKHLFSIGNYLIGSMKEIGFKFTGSAEPSERSGIFSFINKDSQIIEGLYDYLYKNKIYISVRNGALRVSPHFYNKESDIDALVKMCKDYIDKN